MKKYIVPLLGILLLFFVVKNTFLVADTDYQNLESQSVILNLNQDDFNVLLYSKAKGWVHEDAIPAAKELFGTLAKQNNWKLTITDDSSIYTPEQLDFFDVVVWNNVTGNTLDEKQRAAFKNYLEGGGGFVGFHGSGDNSRQWDWYYEEVIRAEFSHHPIVPQFQVGTLNKECPESFPACEILPIRWDQEEEWYVFYDSPRKKGSHILYTLDETDMVMSGVRKDGTLQDKDFDMGDDHPIAWYNCVGKGKAFYSALGHKAYYYSNPNYNRLLTEAVNWAGNPLQKCTI